MNMTRIYIFALMMALVLPFTILSAMRQMSRAGLLAGAALIAVCISIYAALGPTGRQVASSWLQVGNREFYLICGLLAVSLACLAFMLLRTRRCTLNLSWGAVSDATDFERRIELYLKNHGWTVSQRRRFLTVRVARAEKGQLAFSLIALTGGVSFDHFANVLWRTGATPAGNYIIISVDPPSSSYVKAALRRNIKVLWYKDLLRIETAVVTERLDFSTQFPGRESLPIRNVFAA